MSGTDGAAVLDEQVQVATGEQMRALGAGLAALLQPGDLIVLSGPLGAGKTTLAQGIGSGLGVQGPVTSPTFVIARVHPSLGGGPDLVHADAYRLGSRAEVDDHDLDADLDRVVTVVEWGEGLVEDLAPGFLAITISRDAGDRSVGGPAAAGPAAPGGAAAGDGGPGDQDADDEPRTVRVVGRGERWAAAAGPARLILAGLPEVQ